MNDPSPILIMAQKRTSLTDKYMELSLELIKIKKGKALVWPSLRSGVSSDTQAERSWQGTKDGIREMELGLVLKATEKQLSALKLEVDVLRDESKNQY